MPTAVPSPRYTVGPPREPNEMALPGPANDDDGDGRVAEPVVIRDDRAILVLSCRSCRTILGDTSTMVDMSEKFGNITVLVASNVVVHSTQPVMSSVGYDAISVYLDVVCGECGAVVGKQYISTPTHMDGLRHMFTLSLDAITTYEIGSGRSSLSPSDSTALRGLLTLHDIRQQYERISDIVMILFERMDTLEASSSQNTSNI